MKIRSKIFGGFFAIVLMLSSLFGLTPGLTENAYAEPTGSTTSTTCEDSLGSLGWLVCPGTGKVSEAVDFLYDKIEGVLEINPVEMEDGSPIYEIWKYFQGVTNVLFIVFLLVVVFSQITGVGITNYGIKKALPKLIIAAVLVNLSFYICSLAVDVSNIFGDGIRGMFDSIAASTSGNIDGSTLAGGVGMSDLYSSLAGGTSLAIAGGAIAFETGAIWMLIPLVLGALVSVVIGIITIAMRQAVVTLLIMIAPLAMIAYILPNTEQWFKKWRHLLFQMLIFYPAFSLLFGASSVAGWAIIVSSQNGFGVLIGIAVQVFPLFFSWSLMKMSGTVLGTINSKLNSLTTGPLTGARGWATSHRELSRQKHLASKNAYTPSMRLQQFLSDRKIAREEEIREHTETVKNRGLAYAASRNYKKGTEIPSKEGEEAYEAQARNAEYKNIIERHKNNMNKGLGQLEAVIQNGTVEQKVRLYELDAQNVQAFDTMKMEQSRAEMIDYNNAIGYHDRMEKAMNAHMDNLQSQGKLLDKNGNPVQTSKYKRHFADNYAGELAARQARDRYSNLSKVMEGDTTSAHYAAATAAHAYDTQNKIVATKMQKYFDMTPPTQDVVYRLDELTRQKGAAQNMDSIVSGLRVLNQRGDTDLVQNQINNLLDKNVGGGVQLGTHASQALASFLMLEMKDSDPFLRRFGKYINLETARVYNENERKMMDLSYDEYIKGYHLESDGTRMYAKKDMIKLMEGTSLDNIERTAFSNFDENLKKAYGFNSDNKNAPWDVAGWIKKREEIQTAFEPAFLSASLKWLSGSEQINSAVRFWTGFEQKQKTDDNGNLVLDEYGDPVYILKPTWAKGGFIGVDKDGRERDYSDEVERYYRQKTNDYFKDQTTGQILGMRTDYRDATMEHLVDTYLKGIKSEDKMTDEERREYDERQAEYEKERAEIQTRYDGDDYSAEEAEKLRKKDLKDLKMKIAGKQVRKILGETGKLEQIYRTRRSGAANNAKDWLRKWVNLDDEETMAKEVKYYENLRKAQRDEEQARDAGDGEQEGTRIYDSGTRKNFRDQVDKAYHDNQDMNAEEFYQYCLKMVRGWFGGAPTLIEEELKEYYNNQVKGKNYVEAYNVKQVLEDILQDPSKYPDA